jgi:HAD superfamily phosphoserine phosphatase-like hydrolase
VNNRDYDSWNSASEESESFDSAQGARRAKYKSVIFDVDSTVAGIEGIDWLAALRGEGMETVCAGLTARAMSGELRLEQVYLQRLEHIRPTAAELMALADAYQQSIQPGARELIQALQVARVHVHLVSGGLRAAIIPMALQLGVPADRVHAVSLLRAADGSYCRLDEDQPLATQQGKPLVVQQLGLRTPTVMIGDGSTDAAVRGVVDAFIAYTGVVRRENIVAVADAEAASFEALYPLLFV